jgi:hypothetical protein
VRERRSELEAAAANGCWEACEADHDGVYGECAHVSLEAPSAYVVQGRSVRAHSCVPLAENAVVS